MTHDSKIPVAVLGATGYVAGETLRLIAGHPDLELRAAVSRSRAGTPLAEVFPHLASAYPGQTLVSWDELHAKLGGPGPLAVFGALPHGESARLLDELLVRAQGAGTNVKLVDLSADFRHPDPALYETIYGTPHAATERLATFTSALPDLVREDPAGPVAHPGCFTTAVSLACRPLVARGLVREPRFLVSAVTGSTGSGRSPKPGTHHPERHGGFRAYNPLRHRHAPEMARLIGGGDASGIEVLFVPHSGPFARGIHATVHVRLQKALDAAELAQEIQAFYADSPFVFAGTAPPSLKDVVGTNRCHLGVSCDGDSAVVLSAIDNLTKGAAGGALQWMNRLLGLPETSGLFGPGLGWH